MQLDARTLAEALAKFRPIVAKQSRVPVLSGVQLTGAGDRLRLAATNLEQALVLEVPAANAAELAVVVPFAIFDKVVQRLVGLTAAKRKATAGQDLTLELDGDHLVVYLSSQRRDELELLAADGFPLLADPQPSSSFTLAGSQLTRAAGQVLIAVGTDKTRPFLTGVLLEGSDAAVALVATDSYRLAVRELPVAWSDGPAAALMPAAALANAAKLFGGVDQVQVAVTNPPQDDKKLPTSSAYNIIPGAFVTFTAPGMRLTTKTLGDQFPRYRTLLPSGYENTATFTKAALVDALDHLAPYCVDHRPVQVHVNGGLELTASAPGVGRGSDHIDAARHGSDVLIGFHPGYLRQGLNMIDDRQIVLEVRDGFKPALLHSPNPDGFTYLLMPVRIPVHTA